MTDQIEMLGDVASVPYGIDHRFDEDYDETVCVIGVGNIKWRITPDELREMADRVEAHDGDGGDE